MADITSRTYTLQLLAGFADADDRTLSISDPKANITEQEIRNLEPLAAPVLIGDKYGAAFTRFKTAKLVEKTIKHLDLE